MTDDLISFSFSIHWLTPYGVSTAQCVVQARSHDEAVCQIWATAEYYYGRAALIYSLSTRQYVRRPQPADVPPVGKSGGFRRNFFYYTVRFARWAAWLGAIDPKYVDLWLEKERTGEITHRPKNP